jgi:YHS domain-containing protein
MIQVLISAFVIAATPMHVSGDLSCPVMGSAVPANAKGIDYAGVRYYICCGGCDTTFAKDPVKYSKAAEGKTIGMSLFDPVSGERVEAKKGKGPLDVKGVRYYFTSDEDMATFKADTDKYTKMPKKEVVFCPVMNHEVENYAMAGGYVDYEGVRYYVCCGDCLATMKKEPAKYAPGVSAKISDPKVRTYKEDQN